MDSIHFFLCTIVCITGLFVFLTNNPVHSILFLILTFFNSAVLLFLLNAEFLGLIFIIVYVGAIAVLFLFVVMMLNVKVIPADNTMYLPLIFIGSIFLFTQLYSFFQKGFTAWNFWDVVYFQEFVNVFDNTANIEGLGQALFNSYESLFLLAGIILLVALLGAINLTLNLKSKRNTEITFRQLARSDKFLSFFK